MTLEPTASGATSTNSAVALEAPVRRATCHTTGWTFNLLDNSAYKERLNKYRVVEFTTSETGDEGTHWYVQFRSIDTYDGQPHERGVFVEAGPAIVTHINGFWANVRYVVRARSYAKIYQNRDHYYSIGENLIEVGGFTTPGCPSGTQHRDGRGVRQDIVAGADRAVRRGRGVVYAWRVAWGGTIAPDDAQTVLWTAPPTATKAATATARKTRAANERNDRPRADVQRRPVQQGLRPRRLHQPQIPYVRSLTALADANRRTPKGPSCGTRTDTV